LLFRQNKSKLVFNYNNYRIDNNRGLGIGDWGLGIGDWANPQSPIPIFV